MNDKNEQLIEEILIKFYSHEKFFNGKNTESASKITQINIPNNERFPIVFSAGLAFLNNNFINLIEKKMKELPPNDDKLDDVNIGYVIPSKDVIQEFINKNGQSSDLLEERIINTSVENIEKFSKDITADIICGDSDLAVRNRVKFITGKVGSGKSTFIEYFARKNKQQFVEKNIFTMIVTYEDIALEEFHESIIENIELNNFEKEKLFKKHIKEILYQKIIEEYFMLVQQKRIRLLFYKDRKFRDVFAQNVCVLLSQDESIRSAKDKAKYIKANFLEQMSSIVKYIMNDLHYNFLVYFDGFDILNPKLINEFDFYVQHVKDIIYTSIEDGLDIYYILTLRNCTFQKFMLDGVVKYHLIPANEDKIILRSLRLVAKENRFVNKYLDQFENMFKRIMKKLEQNLSFDKYKSIVEIFDYNYRLLLDYFFYVVCYVIFEYTGKIKESENTIKQFKQLVDDISINDYVTFEKFLESKFYTLNNILLNKNKLFHTPPYKISIENTKDKLYSIESSIDEGRFRHNKNSLSFLDNIYNYLLPRKYFQENSVFPLLMQFRLLQILDKYDNTYDPYMNLDTINDVLKQLGYKTKYLISIINNLINSKLIKFVFDKDDKKYKYAIRNRGRLVIKNLGLLSSYVDTTAPYMLLPKNIVDKININGKVASDFAYNDILNTYIILNLIRDIEVYELKNNQKLAKEYSIADNFQKNVESTLNNKLFYLVNHYKFKNKKGQEITSEEYLESILAAIKILRKK